MTKIRTERLNDACDFCIKHDLRKDATGYVQCASCGLKCGFAGSKPNSLRIE